MMNKNRNSAWLRVKSLLVPVAFVAAVVLTSFTVDMGVKRSNNSNETSSEAAVKKQQSKVKVTPPANKKENNNRTYRAVEQMPSFPGGTKAMMEFLSKNTQYPEEAAKKGIQGTVFVQFVVEKDGSIKDVKVIRGKHPLLDAEAVRVAKLMPKWTPGKQDGKAVRVEFTMPVKFKLQ